MPAGLPSRPTNRAAAEARPPPTKLGIANRQAFLTPIITMDEGGVLRSANDSLEHVLGWTPVELLGENATVLIPDALMLQLAS